MSGLFGGSKTPNTPAVPVPDPPPAVEDAAVKARGEEDLMRKRKGSAATILTGKKGSGTPTTGAKVLLGG